MSTNYPGALDSFVNPTATDTLDSATVPHAAQHDNINDAMSAVQVTLGVNPQGDSATVVARLTALDSTVAGKANTNQTMYVGTTAIAINRSSASQTLTGVNIDGNAATVTNGITTATTSLPNVTSVNSTLIPASATLLTSGSSLDPARLSSGTAGINISGNAATATTAGSATTAGTATNVSGVVAVANGGTGQTLIPVASPWSSGATYKMGDVVTYNLSFYVRLTNGAGTTAPSSDSTNWDSRSSIYTTNGSFSPSALLATNSSGGIAASGVGIGSIPATVPLTGLTVSNGSITVSGVGNGINIASNGNLTLGTSGNAGGSIAIINTTGVQLIKGSSGTNNHTLPSTQGVLLNDASSLNPARLSAGTASIDISGNAATVTNGVTTATTSLPNVTSVNSTTIPASSTLLTSVSALDGANLTGATVTSAKLASVTGTGTVVVTDTNPSISNQISTNTQYINRPSAPGAVTTSITAGQLLAGWVTSSPSSAQNTSLPTFATLSAVGTWYGGTSSCVDWYFINGGTAAITLTSGTSNTAPTGTTGSPTIAAQTSARFSTRLNAAGTAFVTYRLA